VYMYKFEFEARRCVPSQYREATQDRAENARHCSKSAAPHSADGGDGGTRVRRLERSDQHWLGCGNREHAVPTGLRYKRP